MFGTLTVDFDEITFTPPDMLKQFANSDTAIDFGSTKLLYISDVAHKLRNTPKQIDLLSRRKKNPLPLTRGKGRPFI